MGNYFSQAQDYFSGGKLFPSGLPRVISVELNRFKNVRLNGKSKTVRVKSFGLDGENIAVWPLYRVLRESSDWRVHANSILFHRSTVLLTR